MSPCSPAQNILSSFDLNHLLPYPPTLPPFTLSVSVQVRGSVCAAPAHAELCAEHPVLHDVRGDGAHVARHGEQPEVCECGERLTRTCTRTRTHTQVPRSRGPTCSLGSSCVLCCNANRMAFVMRSKIARKGTSCCWELLSPPGSAAL